MNHVDAPEDHRDHATARLDDSLARLAWNQPPLGGDPAAIPERPLRLFTSGVNIDRVTKHARGGVCQWLSTQGVEVVSANPIEPISTALGGEVTIPNQVRQLRNRREGLTASSLRGVVAVEMQLNVEPRDFGDGQSVLSLPPEIGSVTDLPALVQQWRHFVAREAVWSVRVCPTQLMQILPIMLGDEIDRIVVDCRFSVPGGVRLAEMIAAARRGLDPSGKGRKEVCLDAPAASPDSLAKLATFGLGGVAIDGLLPDPIDRLADTAAAQAAQRRLGELRSRVRFAQARPKDSPALLCDDRNLATRLGIGCWEDPHAVSN